MDQIAAGTNGTEEITEAPAALRKDAHDEEPNQKGQNKGNRINRQMTRRYCLDEEIEDVEIAI